MPNIHQCLIKHPYSDRKGLLEEAQAYEDRGLSPAEASQRAIADRIEDVQGQMGKVAQSVIEAYAKAQPAKFAKLKPVTQGPAALDLKGFDIRKAPDGFFTLVDGDVLVEVTPTTEGRYQAVIPGTSVRSSPHLQGEQGAVDWAANYREEAKRAASKQEEVPAADPAEPAAELLNKLAAGYGYAGGIDTMPDGLGKTARKLQAAILERDLASALDILRPDNKRSREAFESLFDGKVKLPNTIKGTRAVLEDFLGKIEAGGAAEAAPSDKDDLAALFDEVLAEETAPKAKRAPAEAQQGPSEAARQRAASMEIVHRPGSAAEYIVREPHAAGGGYQNYASFTLSATGRPIKVSHFFESPSTREPVELAIQQWAASNKQAEAKRPRTATQSATSAAKNTAAGLSDTISALGALFKPKPGTLRSGVGWDEDTYRAAQPLFKQAIAHFKDAGQDLKEAMRAIVRMVLDQFGADTAANMKPYVVRFMEDVRDGKINYDETVTRAQDENNEPIGNDRGDESALAPVSPGELQDPEGGGEAGEGSDGGRGSDAGGNGRSGENLPDQPGTGLAGEPGTVLPEEPDTVNIDGQEQPLEAVAESVKNDPPASEPKPKYPARFGTNPGNYRITGAIGTGTPGERIRANLAAVRLVLALEQENRYPTREEQAVLAQYVGWGGLKNVFKGDNSTSKQERTAHAELKRILTPEQLFWMGQSVLDAHYTSRQVVGAMYKVLAHFGIEGGRFLEPTVGVGNFIGLMPEGMASGAKWYASEIDPITSLIAKNLYPEAQILPATGFQDAEFAYGRMDVAIGNPPFGDQRITDTNKKRADINGFKIHNYILAKSAMHLRPGGIMSFVVTSRFLDTANPEAREYLAKNFRFLGGIRLPNTAFKENAGTEVTTDLIFLQRMREDQHEGDDAWLDTGGRLLNEDGETVTLNRYFAENPGMMLGKPSMAGTMYGGNKEKGEFTLEAIPGLDINQEIERILAEDWAGYKGIGRPRKADQDAMAASMEFNREDIPVGGFYLENGRVIQRIDDDADGNTQFRQLTPETPWTEKQTLGATKLARIAGMLELRELAYDLMAAERGDMGTDFIEGKRQILNERYDAFVKEYGFLNDNANRRLMNDDPRIEFGLEANYTKEITKADAARLGQAQAPARAEKTSILKERVFFPKQEVLSADTPADGYAVSLAEKGRLDLDYISELTGLSVDKVVADLSSGAHPLIYRDPVLNRWVQEDEYLSGNVKDKLKAARGAGLAANIKGLEAVQPEDVPAPMIHAEFGATWIRQSVYEDFLRLLGYQSPQVAVMPKSGAVEALAVGSAGASPFRADLENPDYTIDKVFSAVANRRQMVAYDGWGDTRTVNTERTENLGRIRNKMIAIWNDWIKSDPERADLLARDYNELMNTTAERRYDGVKHLLTVGANPAIELRNSQKNASWRMIQSSITLLDHVVGAGKTIALTTGIMERKRLGLSKKPMVMVPNHLVGQWARDWLALYPGANILAATEKDFAKANRRRLFARIATGKFDAVIVGHSSFGFIPVSRESEVKFVMSEVKHLEEALSEAQSAGGKTKEGKESRQVRAIKNRIAKRMEKIRELQAKPRDNVVTFEDMGIDYLAVDELHEFKNLEYATTLSNVAGMGSPEGSKKAFDLFMKMRLLEEEGGGIAGATGTPLSNSMVEMYSLLRYLNPGALAARGVQQFDAWIKAFASIEPRDEYTASGKIKQRTVLAAFNNLPELLQAYKQVADTITMADLKRITAEQIRLENQKKGTRKREEFPVPKVAGGGRVLDISAPTPEQVEFMDYLIARADILDKLKGKQRQEYARIDNALWLMNDARKMSLDVRIIDPTAPDNPDNKVNRAARKIKAIYDRTDADLGTQLVFCDLSTPSKNAAKDAKDFIKKTLEALGLEKDAATKDSLEGKSYRDQWGYLSLRAESMLEAGTLTEAKREAIEAFLEKVGDEELSALQTADVGFSVYDALRDNLIAAGVPAREIAFIHDATTSDKKKELFDLVNAGKVRVLLGSSAKMGAGTNVQKRVVALHHMDAPWRPSDIEQREGRVIRQGNMFYERNPDKFAVDIVAYSTERTFDAQMWGVLARKAAFLEQFRSGLRSIKEEGSDADSYAEFMATATGDQIFRQKIQMERELNDLEAEERGAKMKRGASEQIVQTADAKRSLLVRNLERAKRLAGADLSSITFEGKTYRNDLSEAIEAETADYREKRAAYDQAEAEYQIARKAWEDAAGTERGRAPSKPVKPEAPEINSEGMIARSEWSRFIDALTRKMELVSGEARYEPKLVAANGIELPVVVTRDKMAPDAVRVTLDANALAVAWARSTTLARALTANNILGQLREAPRGYESSIQSLDNNVAQAKITLEHVKPVDPAAIADLKARYEEVKKAVDAANQRLAEERAQRANRFIARDGRRFAGANAAANVDAAPREIPASARFRKVGNEVQYADGIKDVPLAGLDDYTFFALNDKPTWHIIETTTGLSIGKGDTRKAALEQAESTVARIGVEKVIETIGQSIKITDEERRAAYDKAKPSGTSVFRSTASQPTGSFTRQEAESFLRGFLARYQSAPEIVAVDSFADLPAEVRQDATDMGFTPSSINGTISNTDGRLYVVIGNHHSMAAFQATVFHEVLGHAGIRKLMGTEFVQKLNQLFVGVGGMEGLARIMEKRGLGQEFRKYLRGVEQARGKDQDAWTDAKAHWLMTEEVFAHIAERPQLMDRFMALIGWIRDVLRRYTFLDLANLGTSDMLFMLKQARTKLEGKSATLIRNGVAMGPNGMVDSAGRLIAREGSPEFDALKVLADKLGLSEQPMATVFSFAGQNAKTADKFALATALERLDAGESADTVRQETGWFFGPDGKARFEINDRDASLKVPATGKSGEAIKKSMTVGALLRHPKLFAAYPELANIEVTTKPGSGASFRAAHEGQPARIRVGEDVPMGDVPSVLLHELQHAIQRKEGFATGSNLLTAGSRDAYFNSAGEVEARNVQTRQKMTDEERRGLAPNWTTDVADQDVVVSWNGKEMASEPSDTINVDGIERPRLNSNGKPIHPTEEGIRNFWRWFGDSKVVDGEGRPLVVYHGTQASFDAFDRTMARVGMLGDGHYFTSDAEEAGLASGLGDDGANILPVYVQASSPYVVTDETMEDFPMRWESMGYDGVLYSSGKTTWVIAPYDDQIKSATGNNGNFDASSPVTVFRSVTEGGRDAPRTLRTKLADMVGSLTGESAKTFGWWHKTVGSQLHKAKIDRHYGRVFERAQQYLDDVSRFTMEAADEAPGILPRMDSLTDAVRELWNARGDKRDIETIAAPIYEGTLDWKRDEDGKPVRLAEDDDVSSAGIVWTDDELAQRFGLNDKQIGLYREFRAAVDHSLEQLAIAEMHKTAKAGEMMAAPTFLKDMARISNYYMGQFADRLKELRGQREEMDKEIAAADENLRLHAQDLKVSREEYHRMRADKDARDAAAQGLLDKEISELETLEAAFAGRADRVRELQENGYAPLMRFGKYTVDTVEKVPALDEDGNEKIDPDTGEVMMEDKRLFFGMFESEAEARKAEAILSDEYPQAQVSRGVASEESWQLFGAVNPGSLEALKHIVGAEDELMQRYYKMAVANRSALKRLIHRQGVAGYSQDVGRTLASFLLSNARAGATALHFGDLLDAAAEIPKSKGDVQDEAVRLINYIRNPNEEAGGLRGLLFLQFLGGSAAAAVVNLTQTVTASYPFLNQFGVSVADIGRAANAARRRMSGKGVEGDGLNKALQLAEEEGVVAPHNIHAIMGESIQPGFSKNRYGRALSHLWGSMFGMAEQFNRETAFIAAYRQAEKMGADGLHQAYKQAMDAWEKGQNPANIKERTLYAGRVKPTWNDYASPYSFAKNAVRETQFVLSKAARPNWARGTVGATLFTFKQFQVFYLEMLKRMPRKQQALALGVLVLLAGLGGAPGADDLDDLIDTLGQALGYDTNAKRWKEQMAAKALGQDGGEFVMRGVSAFLPLELQTRLGMGNLIPASGALKASNADRRGQETYELLGAAGGFYKSLTDAWNYTLYGRYGDALMQGLAPKAVKDLHKAYTMVETGAYEDTRGRKVTDVSMGDAFWKAVGFQPTAVSTIQRAKGMAMQDIGLVKAVEASIAELWAQGVHEKDKVKVERAQGMLSDWNEKNQESKIRINVPQQVMRRAREMGKTATDRLERTAPKEMRARIGAQMAEVQ